MMPYCNICGCEIDEGLYCESHREKEEREGLLCPPREEKISSQENTPTPTEEEKRTSVEEEQVPPTREERKPRGRVVELQIEDAPKKHPIYTFCKVADDTHRYSEEERQGYTLSALLCYLGPLCLIPLVFQRRARYVRFHLNQGISLCLLELMLLLVAGVACLVDPILPIITPFLAAAVEVMGLISLFCSGIGIANAITRRAKELPLIGACRWLPATQA